MKIDATNPFQKKRLNHVEMFIFIIKLIIQYEILNNKTIYSQGYQLMRERNNYIFYTLNCKLIMWEV